MGGRKYRLLKLVIYLAVITIIAPVIIMPVWSFAGRWVWPSLFPEAFSMKGMEELFGRHSEVLQVLFSSISLSLIVAVLAAAIGAMTARALVFYDFKGKELVAFSTMLPIIVPGTAFAMGVHVVFIYLGLADTFVGVILVHLVFALPYTVNIMTDVTHMVGKKLEIQAQVLGASAGRSFLHVTLPLLMPGILSSISMAYIISFSQYFITLMIGGGRVRTLSVVMVPFIQGGDRTIAFAYASLFVFSTVAVFVVLELLIKRFTVRLD